MGSVSSRNGYLYLDFRYRNLRCREGTDLPDEPSNRRRCCTALKRIEFEISQGTFDYAAFFPNSRRLPKIEEINARYRSRANGAPSFQAFAELWFSEKIVEWRKSYIATIRSSLDNHLLPAFGDTAISEVTKASILAFRASLASLPGRGGAASISKSRINHIMTPLRMILAEASDRHSFENPWRNILPLKEPRTQVDPFTMQEVSAIIRRVRPSMRNYYIVRFFTGLRSSEVDGLKWKFVDFDRRLILIRETLVYGRTEFAKTDGSEREIEINSAVLEALKSQLKLTGPLGGYVFCNAAGAPLENRNVTNRVWYPTLDILGIPRRKPYQTRHTAATLWLASGENPEWIARQLGHTTTELLFRVYSRFVPNLTRADGSAFERLLARNSNIINSPADVETNHCSNRAA